MLRWCKLAAGLLYIALFAGADERMLQWGLTDEGANERCMFSIPSAFLSDVQADALDPPECLNKDPSMAQQASDSQRPEVPLWPGVP